MIFVHMERNSVKYKSWLYDQYINLDRCIKDISIDLGISNSMLFRDLKKFRIPTKRSTRIIPSDKIISMYASGMTMTNINNQLRVTRRQISKILRNNNSKRKKEKYDDVLTKDFLIENYEIKKMSLRQISHMLTIPPRTIKKYLVKYNMGVLTRYDQNKIKDDRINDTKWLNDQIKNKSAIEISDDLDIGVNTIYRYARSQGIKFDGNISSNHNEIISFIRSIYDGPIIQNDRQAISPMELDIYLPDLKLAIEYNGLYWHSQRRPNYHQNKFKVCKSKNIDIINIWEHHWYQKKEIVLDIINRKFGMSNRIYARQCVIKEIPFSKCKDFISKNHLQGCGGGSICISLEYDGDIALVMTFTRRTEYFEINRMCSKAGCVIIGGVSRVFKYFVSRYDPTKIISYCDISYFTGGSYEKLGMKFIKITEPGYFYSNNKLNILSRQQCQKHKLIKQGFDPKKSESQIMLEKKYFKIYNCGNYKFEWNKTI